MAREVAAGQAGKEFDILPPLERKRAFTFEEPNYHGTIRLQPVPPRYQSVWTLHAQAVDSFLDLAWRARLTLTQGSLDEVKFTLPSEIPEAAVTGPHVLEVRSNVANGARHYEVRFRRDIPDSTDLNIQLRAPLSGSVSLPELTWQGVQTEQGDLVVENQGAGEVTIRAENAEPVGKADLAFLPANAAPLAMYKTRPGWRVTLTVAALQRAAQRDAFCQLAEFDTDFRRDGTEWHRARWQLRNRTLQFLPVKLPAGASVVSATVAGQTVRPDTGNVGGQPVLLIPLLKTRVGDLSHTVELVWTRRAARLTGPSEQTLDDAELVGITVENTSWTIWPPESWKIAKLEGNMEEVIKMAQRSIVLDQLMQEAQDLKSILNSSSVSDSDRRNTVGNLKQLQSKIVEEDEKLARDLARGRYSGGRGEGSSEGRREYAQQLETVNRQKEERQKRLSQLTEEAKSAEALLEKSKKGLADKDAQGEKATGALRGNRLLKEFGGESGQATQWFEQNAAAKSITDSKALGGKAVRGKADNLFFNDNVSWNKAELVQKKQAAEEKAMAVINGKPQKGQAENSPTVSAMKARTSDSPQGNEVDQAGMSIPSKLSGQSGIYRQRDASDRKEEKPSSQTTVASVREDNTRSEKSNPAPILRGANTYTGGKGEDKRLEKSDPAPASGPASDAGGKPFFGTVDALTVDERSPGAPRARGAGGAVGFPQGGVPPMTPTQINEPVTQTAERPEQPGQQSLGQGIQLAAHAMDGRRSLTVDFAPNGQPLRLSKLKGNATVVVKLEPPNSDWAGYWYLGVVCLVGIAIELRSRVRGRRPSRNRIA
jgi:hypothetical protein